MQPFFFILLTDFLTHQIFFSLILEYVLHALAPTFQNKRGYPRNISGNENTTLKGTIQSDTTTFKCETEIKDSEMVLRKLWFFLFLRIGNLEVYEFTFVYNL